MAGLKVAILGAGLMGRWHAHEARRAGAAVAAVVDPDVTAARELARRYRAAVYGSLEAVSDLPGIGLVHVCTPLSTHAALADSALRAGKHVIVEKPVAETLFQTEALLALARQQGRLLVPVHQFTFQAGVQRALRRLPALGDLVRLTFQTFSAGGTGRTDAQRRAVLLEILPHPVGLFRAVLGDVFSIDALEVAQFTDDDLELTGQAGGTRLHIVISLRARPTRNELVLAGTRGTITADLFHGYAVHDGGGVSRVRKALLPFSHGLGQLSAAGMNLLSRTLRAQWAYPGLRGLIRRCYAAAAAGTVAPVGEQEIRDAAALIDRVRGAGNPVTEATE